MNSLNTYHQYLSRIQGMTQPFNRNEIELQRMKLGTTLVTHRGTKVDMIQHPAWGTFCFMDDTIQSCEVDERTYHEALVQPAMRSVKKRDRVLIVGGGEGATAREVLKWPDVKQVDMYEWDRDVVRLFQTAYPQWAKGAWLDSRLTLYYEDIFDAIQRPPSPSERYDVVIIDLFDPEEESIIQWYTLLMKLPQWVHSESAIVMYAGVNEPGLHPQPYQRLKGILEYYDEWQNIKAKLVPLNSTITPYKVFIPSFMGDSTFLLLTPPSVKVIEFDDSDVMISCHITNEVWVKYTNME
jgi:predicted membrane-bound spermidine synthase